LPTSPEAASKSIRTFVDPTLALDEVAKRLIQVFVFGRVPQRARPFAPGPEIHLFPIRGAENYRCEWFRDFGHRWTALQTQGAASVLYVLAVAGPPFDKFKKRA